MQPLEILNELQLEWSREHAAVRQLKTQCTSNVERRRKSKNLLNCSASFFPYRILSLESHDLSIVSHSLSGGNVSLTLKSSLVVVSSAYSSHC